MGVAAGMVVCCKTGTVVEGTTGALVGGVTGSFFDCSGAVALVDEATDFVCKDAVSPPEGD